MIVVPEKPSVSKRELSYAFFLSAGALFTGVLITNGTYLLRTAQPTVSLGVLSGVVPSVAFASSRCWLPRTQLSGEQIWRVATWGGLGIAVLTAVDVGLVLTHLYAEPVIGGGLASLMGQVAAGGVIGVLIGTAWELNMNVRSAKEQNSVLNRILRHNIRNDVNVIQGSAKLIRDGKGDPAKHADRIMARSEELMKVSEQVRRIQDANDPDRLSPSVIDVADVVRDRMEVLRRAHPEVTVESTVPTQSLAYADGSLDTVIDNLLENGVEHSEGPTRLSISVGRDDRAGWVTVDITDNGPGIPPAELEVLENGPETQLNHSTGTGLWIVKWYTEQNDGRLQIDSSAAGTRVRLALPAAIRRPPAGGPLDWARWFVRLTGV